MQHPSVWGTQDPNIQDPVSFPVYYVLSVGKYTPKQRFIGGIMFFDDNNMT